MATLVKAEDHWIVFESTKPPCQLKELVNEPVLRELGVPAEYGFFSVPEECLYVVCTIDGRQIRYVVGKYAFHTRQLALQAWLERAQMKHKSLLEDALALAFKIKSLKRELEESNAEG